ncbi:thiol-disulfide oxidoreductase DCC family protein [Pseudoalteromonas luteoviolacea]|uniref:Putative redox protein n=1 Tax=Pseudoalteromonas luteoviolacea S4054 TaxID=1129367 RepID=A0A0F6AAQ2_9GAMM|nr:DUF393 domain-containing protein [Pseudoalteromonas luteoviolacea]AOT11147.1 redox protein [Pseudoalteromonas luteoviolacea]AOT15689.1 redox protein [Pseudoalteromonas luteoviolacea]AOT20968.1 redox protein [Pseudoalteromonas luteoviolacea]KKE82464.1 putative redox protein [Pseudoalteromonas luteoviolacea S4054]KZN67394.1 putative redox protein [Pseudoalteromonas luteoviolacea S4047-1]
MTKLTIFYDGTCPLCVKEMMALTKRDKSAQIKTVDIHNDEFINYPHIDPNQANLILHALDEQDGLLLGLDVTHRAWQLVGMGWLYAPLRWPLIKPMADKLYLLFAKNRYRISYLLTGKARCESGACRR